MAYNKFVAAGRLIGHAQVTEALRQKWQFGEDLSVAGLLRGTR